MGPESPARRSGRERKPTSKLVQLQQSTDHKPDTIIMAAAEENEEDAESEGEKPDQDDKTQQG